SENSSSICTILIVIDNFTTFFFFQAEDGIRDGHVTGVQTCALPILRPALRRMERAERHGVYFILKSMEQGQTFRSTVPRFATDRSEERRVGKECRSRWSANY